uniref:Type II toxin-antitoxin system PemK/MazF family toxin n=1 Tax=candidate division WWE3 bacterium TaxID=2053526 RepID=A0A7C4TQ23_UNCKA
MNEQESTWTLSCIKPSKSNQLRGKVYPTRISCTFKGKQGLIVLDQIRTVDKARLVKRIGKVDNVTQDKVLEVLAEMFAP